MLTVMIEDQSGGGQPFPVTEVLAFAALVLTAWAAVYNGKKLREQAAAAAASALQSTRHANYTRLHELLIDPRAASGRRKLFIAAASSAFPDPHQQDWDHINYSLALYDTLGGYIMRGLVDEDLVLEQWWEPLCRIRVPAHAFAEHRRQENDPRPWAFLFDLLDRAESYRRSRTEGAGAPPSQTETP